MRRSGQDHTNAIVFAVLAAVSIGRAAAGSFSGGLMEFDDRQQWIDSIGDFGVIGFTGFQKGTILGEQYADQGLVFPDGNDSVVFDPIFTDDYGAFGGNFVDDGIRTVFSGPRHWIGVDFPGNVKFQLFSGGKLVGESRSFRARSTIDFAGIISMEPFDEAIIRDTSGSSTFIDNLYFGVPGPGTLGLLGLALLAGTRRRCG